MRPDVAFPIIARAIERSSRDYKAQESRLNKVKAGWGQWGAG